MLPPPEARRAMERAPERTSVPLRTRCISGFEVPRPPLPADRQHRAPPPFPATPARPHRDWRLRPLALLRNPAAWRWSRRKCVAPIETVAADCPSNDESGMRAYQDLFSLKTIPNGMFYPGGVLLPLVDPLDGVAMGPIQRLQRPPKQLRRSDTNHLHSRRHDRPKWRQHSNCT